MGFLLTLYLVLLGTESNIELANLYFPLSGQITFVILLSTAFSYHASFRITLIRNVMQSLVAGIGLFYINSVISIDINFIRLNFLQVIQGFLSGTLVSWLFFESTRTRFYLKSTDADTRQHLYNQLSKLVYPHQLERIKLGDELENTMPLKEGKAIVNVFDVQRSSEIRHEKTAEFFMGVFKRF